MADEHHDPAFFDPETHPALSPTIGWELIDECPAYAYADHRLLGGGLPISDDKLARRERGKALHNIVLEDGDRLTVVDADSWRSSAAKAERAKARAEGRIPVLYPVLKKELQPAAEKIGQSMLELGVSLAEGVTEEKVHWLEASEYGDVLCSGILDYRSADGSFWADLKTTEGSVKPEVCEAQLRGSAGLMQDCAYTSAMGQRFPDMLGRIKRLFIFAQSRPPFLVTPVYLDGEDQKIGEARWQRAIRIWGRCLKEDYWPAYVEGPTEVHPPAWALRELELEGVDR